MARGGGGSGVMTREVQVSKKMSWLLRHGAEKEGLTLGAGGYINVQEVVS
jgi:2'-phosphotransferase